MNIVKSLVICFSMYSVIPMPKVEWSEKNMRYCFCFFPAIGLIIGFSCLGVYGLLTWLSFSRVFISVILLMLSIILSGGIHLDGFIDTCDGIFSYGDKDKKLEILKDPHIGAFGVIGCAGYLLILFAAYVQMVENHQFVILLPLVFTISRAIGAIALQALKKAKSTGLGSSFSQASQRRTNIVVDALWLLISLSVLIVISIQLFAILAVAFLFGGMVYYHAIIKQFGGITGDLTGFLIMFSELIMLMTIAVGGKLL